MKATYFISLALVGVMVAGCTTRNQNAGYGYCDETGCYQCDLEDTCWPLTNQQCSSNLECPAEMQCTSIGCAPECAEENDCPQGESCVDGFCAPWGFNKVLPYLPPSACSEDSACPTDQFCNDGTCVDKCKSDEECGPDKVCTACGKCQPKEIPATCGTVQVYCSETVSCGDGKACLSGRCHFSCDDSSDSCPVGQVCKDSLCQDDPAPQASECVYNFDCGEGSCINGYCHASCKAQLECGHGHVCLVGLCQPDYNPVN